MRIVARMLTVLMLSIPWSQAQTLVQLGSGPDSDLQEVSPLPLGSPAPLTFASRKGQIVSFTFTSRVKEGGSGKGIISFKYPEKEKVKFSIQPRAKGQVKAPGSVTMPAGATRCEFEFSIANDKIINLTREVVLNLFLSKDLLGVGRVTVLDDEKAPVMALKLPKQLLEGAASTGAIALDRPAAVDFDLAFVLSPAGQIKGPSALRIRAGVKEAEFKIRATDDALIEDTMEGKVTIKGNGIKATSAVTKLIDNEARKLLLTLPAAITEGVPGFGTVAVPGVLPADLVVSLKSDGTNYLASPSSVTIPAGKKSVNFPLGAKDQSATDETHLVGITATASTFTKNTAKTSVRETIAAGRTRTLRLATKDLIWDASRGRIYASVSSAAGVPYGNHVIAIDPSTLAITASVEVNDDPGQLALTSGGEALYVARDGNGTISKIDLTGFTVASSFAVGTTSQSRKLYAVDICTVAGQPDLLVVAQFPKIGSILGSSVAVYDHGVSLIQKASGFANRIEPSAEPGVFFGYNNITGSGDFRKYQLGATGITVLETKQGLVEKQKDDIHSDGNMVFSNTGIVVDGQKMDRVDFLPFGGLVLPELAKDRVYVLKTDDLTAVKIVACNPASFLPIHEIVVGGPSVAPEGFTRWGGIGFAVRGAKEVTLIENIDLVTSGTPTDLAVTMSANPTPAMVGTPLTYSITATNQGPNIARGTIVSAALSFSQAIASASASVGAPSVSGRTVNLAAGDLAPGETRTLTIVTSPESAGSLTCKATAYSRTVDSASSNNAAVAEVAASFQSGPNTVNALRLTANNLIYDANRAVFWASIPISVGNPLSGSVLSINPLTGVFSTPLPLGANPNAGAMALSSNGRYLYLGLSDVAAVHRIDLATPGQPSLRIPLVSRYLSSASYARDIEVLDGDGTSFIIVGSEDRAALVYDGVTLRSAVTDYGSVDRIEPSGTPGIYIGSYGSSLKRLSVTSSGVAVVSDNPSVITTQSSDINASGGLVLAQSGHLVDAASLALIANLRDTGAPCVDSPNKRAYLATPGMLKAFDTTTGNSVGSMALSIVQTGAAKCVRWGSDGFGVVGNDGKIYIVRWSLAVSPVDSTATQTAMLERMPDGNQKEIMDSMRNMLFRMVSESYDGMTEQEFDELYLGDLDSDGITDGLEFLFGTSSSGFTPYPVTQTAVRSGEGQVIHVKFPRHVGIEMPLYGYEISTDQNTWTPVTDVDERIISIRKVDGTWVEHVDTIIRVSTQENVRVRLRWGPLRFW